MPRPGTPVIHPSMLTKTLRPIAERAQTGWCQLLRPASGQGVLDPETLTYSADAADLVWSGPCRFQPKARALANVVQAGEQPVTQSENQVSIPITAPEPKVNDLLKMIASSDPGIVRKVFRVVSVSFGDLQGERHLTCQDNETSRPAA